MGISEVFEKLDNFVDRFVRFLGRRHMFLPLVFGEVVLNGLVGFFSYFFPLQLPFMGDASSVVTYFGLVLFMHVLLMKSAYEEMMKQ